jgi:hypothetical protein
VVDDDDDSDLVRRSSQNAASKSYVRVILHRMEPSLQIWDTFFVHAAHVGLHMETALEHVMKNASQRMGVRKESALERAELEKENTERSGDASSSSSMRVYILFSESSGVNELSSSSGHTASQLYSIFTRMPTIEATPVLLLTPGGNTPMLVDAPCYRLPPAWAIDSTQWSKHGSFCYCTQSTS